MKRKILEGNRAFDETELGFPKFSKFLLQASEHGIVELKRTDTGNFEVSLPATPPPDRSYADVDDEDDDSGDVEGTDTASEAADPDDSSDSVAPSDSGESTDEAAPIVVEVTPPDRDGSLRLGPRRGSTRRRGGADVPLLFEGQIAGVSSSASKDEPDEGSKSRSRSRSRSRGRSKPKSESNVVPDVEVKTESTEAPTVETPSEPATDVPSAPAQEAPAAPAGEFDAGALGLPTDSGAIVRYLAHRYKGVGERTAQQLVDKFGEDLFRVLRDDPDSIASVVPAGRAEQVLAAWQSDYERRSG